MARRKLQMGVVDVYAWVCEARELIGGARISNIYGGQGKWFLKIHSRWGKRFLWIRPGHYIYVSSVEPYEKGVDKLSVFMRRRIRGGIIRGVSQHGFERIAVIEASKGPAVYRVVAELLPRGFLVVTDESWRILYADRFEELRDRVIKPRAVYAAPPRKIDPRTAGIDELAEALRRGRDIVRGLVKGWGLPGEVSEELLVRAGLYEVKTAAPDTLGRGDIEVLRETLLKLLDEASRGQGYLVYGDGGPVSYTPYEPRLYTEVHGLEARRLESFNEAVSAYYVDLEKREAAEKAAESIRSMRERLLRSIEEQERVVAENAERIKLLNELVTLLSNNYAAVEEALRCAREAREKRGWEHVGRCPGVVGFDKDRGIVIVSVGGRDIPLDIRLDAWGNINRLIREKGVLAGKVRRAREKLEELRRRVEELAEREAGAGERAVLMVKPRQWYERYHWLITSEGFLVIGGRNADQNEALVKRHLEPRDIFMHAEIHGAPAVIIKTRGRAPGERSLREAAVIAACYSRGWREGLGELDVYWVEGGQVSKTPPSGEYIGKGAFMVYGRRNYIRHVRLRLCIGVEEVHDELYGAYMRVIVGPEDLVSARSPGHVCIEPGDTGVGETARRIHGLLREALGDRLGVTVDEVEERVPGPSRIVSVSRGRR